MPRATVGALATIAILMTGLPVQAATPEPGADGEGSYRTDWVESGPLRATSPRWMSFYPPSRAGQSAVYDQAADKMVMLFGGRMLSSINDAWVLHNATGRNGPPTWKQLQVSGPLPLERRDQSAVYDEASDRAIVFGGYWYQYNRPGSPKYLDDVWVLENATGTAGPPAWRELLPAGAKPPPMSWHRAVYDPPTRRMIVYSGSPNNTTSGLWVLDNANGLGGAPSWSQIVPAGGPPPRRVGFTTVYDLASRRMVLFGGRLGPAMFNDVWVLDNASGGGQSAWYQTSPSGGIPSRGEHSAVFDPATRRMTVFGGYAGNFVNDAWVLENATGLGGPPSWSALSPAGNSPSNRSGHSAVLDPASRRMTVFGGRNGPSFKDLWSLENATGGAAASWLEITPSGPFPPNLPGSVYDAAGDRLLAVGRDSWLLANAMGVRGPPYWTPLPTSGIKPAGYAGAPVFDAAHDRVIVTDLTSQLLVLRNATGSGGPPTWETLVVSGSPPPKRPELSAVYDPGSDRMIIHGGGGWGSSGMSDTWILENASGTGGQPAWTLLAPQGVLPDPRHAHTAVYDPASNRMVVFGGLSGIGSVNDTWVLNHANGLGGPASWTRLNFSGPVPAMRGTHSAAYDPLSGSMIVYGGSGSDSPHLSKCAYDDTWELANATGAGGVPSWRLLNASGHSPGLLCSHSAFFNEASGRMLVLHGTDTWVLDLRAPPSAPAVVSTDPADGATGAARDASISIAFDSRMDRYATESAISSSPGTAGAFTWDSPDDTRVTLSPSRPLEPATKYTVTVSTAARSSLGVDMAQPYAFSFTTANGGGNKTPEVIATRPSAGATGVPADSPVEITFSMPMDRASTEGALAVSPAAPGILSWSPDGTRLSLTPSSALRPDTSYTVTVSTVAKSAAGVDLGSPFQFSFTTAGSPGSGPEKPTEAWAVTMGGSAIASLLAAMVVAAVMFLLMRRRPGTGRPARRAGPAKAHRRSAPAPGKGPEGRRADGPGKQGPRAASSPLELRARLPRPPPEPPCLEHPQRVG